MPVPQSIRDAEFEALRDELFAALMDGRDGLRFDMLRKGDTKGLFPRLFRVFDSFIDSCTVYLGRIPRGSLYGHPSAVLEVSNTEHSDGNVSIDIDCKFRYSYILRAPGTNAKIDASAPIAGTSKKRAAKPTSTRKVLGKSQKPVDKSDPNNVP